MSNVITSFLVGLGYDTSEMKKGERDFNTSMDGIKSAATIAGAVMASAFVAAGKVTIDVANQVNELRLKTNTLNSSTAYVNDYGNALRLMGGNASDAVGEITNVEKALTDLKQKGDASTFSNLAYSGVDVGALTRTNSGGEFMEELARQYPGLTREQQKTTADTLGLSPATVELLRKGSDGYRQILNHANDVAGLTPQLIQGAKDYNLALAETELKWDGIKNTIAEGVLPSLTQLTTEAGSFVDYLNQAVRNNPEKTKDVLGGVAVGAAGSVVSTVGAGAAKLGIPGGAALRGAGNAGILIGAGQIANETVAEPLQKKYPWLQDNPVTRGLNSGFGLNDWLQQHSVDGPGWIKDTFGLGSDEKTPNVDSSHHETNSNYSSEYNNPVTNTYNNQTPYTPSAMMNDYNPMFTGAANTGAAVADSLRQAPLKATVKVDNNINMTLDGRALETKIRDVNQRDNQATIDDLSTTTER